MTDHLAAPSSLLEPLSQAGTNASYTATSAALDDVIVVGVCLRFNRSVLGCVLGWHNSAGIWNDAVLNLGPESHRRTGNTAPGAGLGHADIRDAEIGNYLDYCLGQFFVSQVDPLDLVGSLRTRDVDQFLQFVEDRLADADFANFFSLVRVIRIPLGRSSIKSPATDAKNRRSALFLFRNLLVKISQIESSWQLVKLCY